MSRYYSAHHTRGVRLRTILFGIFLLSIIVRVFWLNFMPVGIVHDNINFLLNAQAFWNTGHDISGTWSPWQLRPVPDEPAQAELTYVYAAPIIGPFGFSMHNAHVLFAGINAWLCVVLAYVAYRMTRSKRVALCVGLIASVNPWMVYFGRTAYEAPVAIAFYMTGYSMLLILKRWWKLLACVPLVFAFYTYMGMKLIFIPLIFLFLWHAWRLETGKRSGRVYLSVGLIAVALFVHYVLFFRQGASGSRIGELMVIDWGSVSSQVNALRRISIASPWTLLFVNKLSFAVWEVLRKYAGAFSSEFLFLIGESSQRFLIFNHGYFYAADVLLIALGIGTAVLRYKKSASFLTGLALLSPLPSVVSVVDMSYAQRSSFEIVPLVIIAGIGLSWMWEKTGTKIGTAVRVVFVFGYVFLISRFLYTYFAIQPVYASEAMAFSQRVTARYISESSRIPVKTYFVSESPKNMFKAYVLYNNLLTRQSAERIARAVQRHEFTLQNTSFVTCQDVGTIDPDATYVYDPGERCAVFTGADAPHTIPQLADGGTVYRILNDRVCSPYELRRYPEHFTQAGFAVERLPVSDYCRTHITNLE